MKDNYRVTVGDKILSITIDIDETETMDALIDETQNDLKDRFGAEVESVTIGQACLSHTSSISSTDANEIRVGSNFDTIQSGTVCFTNGAKAAVNFNTQIVGLELSVIENDNGQVDIEVVDVVTVLAACDTVASDDISHLVNVNLVPVRLIDAITSVTVDCE